MKFAHKLSVLFALTFVTTQLFAREITGYEAQQKIKGAEKIITGTKNHIPEYIAFRNEATIPFSSFDSWAHRALKLSDSYGFKLLNVEKDALGMQHYRYRQTYKSLELEGTMFLVHVKNDQVISVNGTLFNKIQSGTAPAISESTALTSALTHMSAEVYRWQIPQMEQQLKTQTKNPSATWYPTSTLVLAPVNGEPKDANYTLAYRFDVYAEKPLKREYVFVNASTGEVIYSKDRIHHTDKLSTAVTAYSGVREIIDDSVNTTTYRLREAGRGNGIETYNLQQTTNYTNTDFFDTDNYWNNVNAQLDEYAGDAHWGAEKTYDFYHVKFNRNSIDDNGFALISYVHYDVNYTNAFWDGTEMTYGDGDGGNYTPFTALDVTGHEISHGLTEFTSGLNYSYESGAMNEAFSDCMGNSIRHYGKPAAQVNWLIGDEISSSPFRSMSDPNAYGDPDTYQGNNWATGAADNGGVHTNSGVMNHWFYLLSDGGTGTNDNGDAYTVTGLGIDNAAAICFRMNTVYLVPTSQYADARTYAIQAAIDLFGPCTNEVMQTANAWHAVGVGNAFTPGVTSDFLAPVTVFCSAPASVDFSNQSSNAGTFRWDFGDGATSNAVNPTHIYSSYGNYTVSLIADGGSCGLDTVVKMQFVNIDSLNPCIVSLPNTGAATTQTSCSGQLYDSGGPSGDYSDNTNSTITIAPVGASFVTLNFSSFDFEAGFDYLYVYDGPTTSSTLIGTYDGTALPNGGTITSTTGSITIRQTTDGGLTRPGFALTWNCTLSNVPPVANFSANTTSSCSGTIAFSDNSTNGPTTWAWDFGDGGTSNSQNPTHTYIANGTYTVVLIVSNANGSDTLTMNNYVTVSLPVAPTGTGGSACFGSSATLSASGSGVIAWYSAATGGTLLGTGNVFNTPALSATRNFYAEDDIYSPSQYAGPADNTFSGGGYFTNTNYHDLVFDCYSPVILKSVKVYATGSGNRTITLIQNGVTLQSLTVNIPDGESRVDLNFDLPVGTNLELGCENNTSLYRNNGGAVFPYLLSGVVSITGTNAGQAGYYYYFYDWELQDYPCQSARVAVQASVLPSPTASFTNVIAANVVDFTSTSTNAVTYNWTFGDGNSSNLQNPTNVYASLGSYVACLTVAGSNACTDTVCQTITVTSVGVEDVHINKQVEVFPNPVMDRMTVRFNADASGKSWTVQLNDMIGQAVQTQVLKNVQASADYQLNLSSLAPGAYILILKNDEHTLQTRIVKQ